MDLELSTGVGFGTVLVLVRHFKSMAENNEGGEIAILHRLRECDSRNMKSFSAEVMNGCSLGQCFGRSFFQ